MSLEIPSLETKEQVTAFLIARLHEVKEARAACDLIREVTPRRKAYDKYLLRLGKVRGAAVMAAALGKIDDQAYQTLTQEALITMLPTVIK